MLLVVVLAIVSSATLVFPAAISNLPSALPSSSDLTRCLAEVTQSGPLDVGDEIVFPDSRIIALCNSDTFSPSVNEARSDIVRLSFHATAHVLRDSTKAIDSESDSDRDKSESDSETNLTPQLPPSNRSRRLGISIAIFIFFVLICLLYVFRSSIPHTTLLTQSNYSPFSPSFSPSSLRPKSHLFRFRPASGSLLRWAQEEAPPLSPRHTVNVFSVGDLDDEEVGYEEIGLLPTPRSYQSTASFSPEPRRNYGTLSTMKGTS